MNPIDFWTWNKENIILAFVAGLAFAVGDVLVRAIVGIYKKRRATSVHESDR